MIKAVKIGLLMIATSVSLAAQISANHKTAQSIRSIDFKNFTYPWPQDLIDRQKTQRTFRLINGELPATPFRTGMIDAMGVYFGKINYGDVTGDGADEAIIFVGLQTGGSAMPGIIYIYTLSKNRPKLLQSFTTGDRAEGGYRNAYVDEGKLIVELNSPIGNRGDCCPTQYTRTQYQWHGKRFQKKIQTRQAINPNNR